MGDNKLLLRFYTAAIFRNKHIQLLDSYTLRRILADQVQDDALEDLRILGMVHPLLLQMTPFLLIERIVFVVVGLGEVIEDACADDSRPDRKHLRLGVRFIIYCVFCQLS